MPQTKNVQEVIDRACDILQKKGVKPCLEHCYLETVASLKWSCVVVGGSSCLTATRCATGGHYMIQRPRMMDGV